MIYLKLFEIFKESDIPHGGEFNFGNLSKEDINKISLFLDDLKNTCLKNNIKLRMENKKGIPFTNDENGIMVNGYFDEDGRELACAVGKDINFWLTILIHESSHMDQFLENDPSWTNNMGLSQTDDWLNGDDDIDLDLVDVEIKTSIDVEIDCEKRTVEKIKKWKLDSIIDTKEYVQKSNAYILFYRWMRKNRSWYKIGREPYNNKNIVSRMPKTFNTNYSKLSNRIEEIFDTYL